VRGPVPADLQDLVDELADRLGRPVSVEDRRWRLLAFSAHTELEDRVRQASILARAAPPEVAIRLDMLELEQAGDLVDTPAIEAIGMGVRTCAPIRHAGVVLGFVWVIPGPRPLDAAEREALVAMAADAGATLWRRRAAGERRGELLGALLEAAGVEPRRRAAEALAAAHGWPARGAEFALALADADEIAEVGDRARRRWHAGDLVWREWGGQLCALAHLAAGQDGRVLARTLVDAGARCAGAGSPVHDLAEAWRAQGEATSALSVVRGVPTLGPAAAYADLGAWPMVATLWTLANRPSAPAPLPALLAHRHGADLAQALEATLDAAGDVARAARELHVHRATLYRRLERAQELTGLDLASGDDRLRAHLALRMWRLAGAPADLP
jgi:hypothetical protein